MSATDVTELPPNMVTAQEAGPGLSNCPGMTATDITTPLLATGPVPQHHLFQVTKWRPRTGLTMTQFKFKRDLTRLLAAFGLPPGALDEEQPQIQCEAHSPTYNRTPTN